MHKKGRKDQKKIIVKRKTLNYRALQKCTKRGERPKKIIKHIIIIVVLVYYKNYVYIYSRLLVAL